MVAGYVTPWKARTGGPNIKTIPARELTHLMYAFGTVSAEGLAGLADRCLDAGACDGTAPSTPFGGNFAQLAELKRSSPQLRILISLGGWSGSKYFSTAAATPMSRARFAQSVIEAFFRPYPSLFDGVDVDWEFPVSGGPPGNLARLEDRTNFTRLVAELRRRLTEFSALERRELELTIAVSAVPNKIVNLEAAALASLVDRIHLMAYDYHAGSSFAGFNAPLFACAGDPNPDLNVDASVNALIRAGVPPGKVVLGVAFYGRAVADVPQENGDSCRRGQRRVRSGEGATASIIGISLSGDRKRRAFAGIGVMRPRYRGSMTPNGGYGSATTIRSPSHERRCTRAPMDSPGS